MLVIGGSWAKQRPDRLRDVDLSTYRHYGLVRQIRRRASLRLLLVETEQGRLVVNTKLRNVFRSVLSGRSDANIQFSELRALLRELGFSERVRGDHHIFWREDVAEIINLQPMRSKAKPYQVRQVRSILTGYRMEFNDG